MKNQIAETILNQLGGRGFMLMTGAKGFYAEASGLQFSLPGRPGYVRNGINKVRVILRPDDTYDVEFYRVAKRGLKATLKLRYGNVYADMLGDIFRNATGLETRFPRIVGVK